MKLKFIFIVLFTYIILPLFSQNSGWELADDTGGYFTSLYEEENGDLIAVMYPKDNLTKIVKLDKDGNQINENYLFTDSMPAIIYKTLFIPSTNSYLLLGSSYLKNDNSDTYKKYLVVANLDKELNVENTKVKSLDLEGFIEHIDFHLTEDEKSFLSIYVFSQGLISEREHVFAKLNKFGEIENVFIDKGHHECFSIIPSNNGYQCLGMQIRNFDNQFNHLNTENKLNFFIKSVSRSLRISENKILIGLLGTYLPELSTGGAVLYYVDNELNVIKKNWIKTELGTPTPNNVFDISPDSSIFISTNESISTGLKSFSVGKFDIDLNLIWQIKHENIGEYRYLLRGLEATNDNGVILYGSRRRWNDFNYAESYMIKFNSQGKLVYTYNIPTSDFLTIKSYPNPSNGPLTLDIQGLIGKADIRIFDALGRNIYVQDDIMDGNNSIDLSALQSGTYVYKIYQRRNEIISGQWVKI